MMLSKLGALESADATDFLTSTLNSYKLGAQDAASVVDKLIAVDNVAATSAGELATALKYSAATAQQSGVSLEQLISYIGTVSSVTRVSAETIGQSFKTMFSRMQDIKAGKIDEDGLGINNVEIALAGVNIKLRDSKTSFRDFSSVLEELAGKWDTLGETQQANLSKSIAGIRQANIFNVLMTNMTMASKLQEEQMKATGLATDRYNIYLQSNEAAANKAKAAWEGLWQKTISSDAVTFFYNIAASTMGFLGDLGNLIPVILGVAGALIVMNAPLIMTQALMVGNWISGAVTGLVMFAQTAVYTGSVLTGLNVVLGTTAVTAGVVGAAIIAVGYAIKVVIDYNKQLAQSNADNEEHWKQVAGASTSTSDSLVRYRAEIERVNQAVKDAGWFTALWIDKQKILDNGLKATITSIGATSKSWGEYSNAVQQAIQLAGYHIDAQGRVYKEISSSTGITRVYINDLGNLTKAQYDVANSADLVDRMEKKQAKALEDGGEAAATLSSRLEGLKGATQSYIDMIKKAQSGELGAGDIADLEKMFPDSYLDMLDVENGKLEVNADMLRDAALAQAKKNLADAEAEKPGDKIIQILKQQIDEMERSIPITREYTEQFTDMLSKTYEAMSKQGSGSSPANMEQFTQLGKSLTEINTLFENGTTTTAQYFGQLQSEIDNLDFKATFGENQDAAQTFFGGLSMNAAQALSQITSDFNTGKIGINEYTSQLQQMGGIFESLGSMVTNFGSSMGMTAEEISAVSSSLGGMTEGLGQLAELQAMNEAISSQWSNRLNLSAQEYGAWADSVANAAASTNQTFTDLQGNILQGSQAIGGWLRADTGNMALFADQSAKKTGSAISNVVSGAGEVLVALGNAIQNFDAQIDFTPSFGTGVQVPIEISAAGQNLNLGAISLPQIGYKISASGSGMTALQGLGKALTKFGQGMINVPINFDPSIYNGGSGGMKDIGKGLGGVSNSVKDLNKTLKDSTDLMRQQQQSINGLLDMVIAKIKQEKEAQKEKLKDELEAYKRRIDAQKDLIKSLAEERDYQKDLQKKEKSISQVQAELEELRLDDSEAAKARRKVLESQLADLKDQLKETEDKKADERKLEELDKEGKAFEDMIDKKIKKIDEYLSKPGKIMEDAIKLVNKKSDKLYKDLMKWNKVYGSGINADVTKAWNDAYAVLEKYKNALGNIDVQHAIAIVLGGKVPSHHDGASGGFVGGSSGVKSNEEFAKLLNGELVVNQEQMSRFMEKTLPTMMGAPQTSSGNTGGFAVDKLMSISVSGNLDKGVIPDLEKISMKVVDRINEIMKTKGFIRRTDLYSV